MDTKNIETDNNPLWNLIHTVEYFLPEQDTSTLASPLLKSVRNAAGSVRAQIQPEGHRIIFQVGAHTFQEIVKPDGNGTNGREAHGITLGKSTLATIDRHLDIVIANGIRYTFCAHVHTMDDAGLARAFLARSRARLVHSMDDEDENQPSSAVFRQGPVNREANPLDNETLIVVETRPRIIVTTLHVRPREETILVTVSSVIIAKP